MKQFIGTMLIGGAVAYVLIKDQIKVYAANLMNDAIDAQEKRNKERLHKR